MEKPTTGISDLSSTNKRKTKKMKVIDPKHTQRVIKLLCILGFTNLSNGKNMFQQEY